MSSGVSRTPDRWILATLLALAVVIRLAAVLVLKTDPRISEPMIDAGYYLDLAGQLARGQAWPAGPVFMSPIYPLLLSLVFRLAGPGVLTVQLFQSLLGLGTLTLLFLAARRDLGRRAAVGAAALFVLCGPILAMESMVLMEALQLFLVTAALWAWPGRNRTSGAPVIFGFACGLLAIGRGSFLVLPVAWTAWMFVRRWRGADAPRGVRPDSGQEEPGRPRASTLPASPPMRPADLGPFPAVRAGVFVLAGLMLALAPLAVYQTRTTGSLHVLALNGGLNIYLGNNPVTHGLYSLPDGIDLEKDPTGVHSASVLAGRALTPVEADRFYAERALAFVRGQPGRALWLLGRKALLFLTPREIPQIDAFDLLRAGAWPLRAAFVDFRWLLPLAVLGIAGGLARRRMPLAPGTGSSRPVIAPWLVVAAVGWLSTILFFATGRHRLPFLAGFLGLAGFGASDLAAVVTGLLHGRTRSGAGRGRHPEHSRGDGRSSPRRVPLRFAALPAVVVLQLLLPGYQMTTALAYDALHLGNSEAARGNPEAALHHYREAVRVDPTFGQAWGAAGAALKQLNRLPEAADAYRWAVKLLPESPVLHSGLGTVYGRLGDHAAALTEFREAVRLDPMVPEDHYNLAVALAQTGDVTGADREFRRALQLDPSSVPAQQGLEALHAKP